MPRPVPVTLIAWLIIVLTLFGAITLAGTLLDASAVAELTARMSQSAIPVAMQLAFGGMGLLVSIVCGIFMLRGANWARLLYVGWGVCGIVFAYITVRASVPLVLLLPGAFKLAAFAFFLFRADANQFFSGASVAAPLYACPCCGYRVFSQVPGSYSICPICFWEDDGVQVANPWFAGGANRPSLVEAQENYLREGAVEGRLVQYVRKPTETDIKDPDWRPVAESDKAFVTTPREIEEARSYTDPCSAYHYWRRNMLGPDFPHGIPASQTKE